MSYIILSFILSSMIGWQVDLIHPELRSVVISYAPILLLILINFPRFIVINCVIAFVLGLSTHAPIASSGTIMTRLASGACDSCYTLSLLTDGRNSYLSSGKIFEGATFKAGKIFSDSPLAASKHSFPPRYVSYESKNVFDDLGQRLNAQISAVIETRPAPAQEWYRSLILGEQPNLSRHIKKAFIETGLYHILAISGLHLSISALILSSLAQCLLFCVQPINKSPSTKIVILIAMRAGILFSLLIYSYCVHFPPSVQRSFLLVAVDLICRSSFGGLNLKKRFQLAAFLQMIFFPVGFLNIGNLLSWLAYFIVVESPHKIWQVARSIGMQLKLTLCCLALTGQISFGGILLNIIVVPLFTPIFCLMILDIVLGAFELNGISEIVFQINQYFLVTILKCHELVKDFFGLLDFSTFSTQSIRIAAYAAMFLMILRNSRFHSIRKISLFKGAP